MAKDHYDQAATYAAHADPEAFVQAVLRDTGLRQPYCDWYRTRILTEIGGLQRYTDLIALLGEPSASLPYLLVIEIQSVPAALKLRVLLEECAILDSRARHGPELDGLFIALPALVHLTGRTPATEQDHRLASGHGTHAKPICWDIAADDARATLAGVASKELSWGMLFWVALMNGGGDDDVIRDWKDLVSRPSRTRKDVVTSGQWRGYSHNSRAEVRSGYQRWRVGICWNRRLSWSGRTQRARPSGSRTTATSCVAYWNVASAPRSRQRSSRSSRPNRAHRCCSTGSMLP